MFGNMRIIHNENLNELFKVAGEQRKETFELPVSSRLPCQVRINIPEFPKSRRDAWKRPYKVDIDLDSETFVQHLRYSNKWEILACERTRKNLSTTNVRQQPRVAELQKN